MLDKSGNPQKPSRQPTNKWAGSGLSSMVYPLSDASPLGSPSSGVLNDRTRSFSSVTQSGQEKKRVRTGPAHTGDAPLAAGCSVVLPTGVWTRHLASRYASKQRSRVAQGVSHSPLNRAPFWFKVLPSYWHAGIEPMRGAKKGY